MKLGEVRKIASVHLQSLSQQKNHLENMLKQDTGGNFDRVEISRELKAINEEYQQTQGVMDEMDQMYGAIANAEVARQQSEALTEAAEDLLKILETFRRISKGDKVKVTLRFRGREMSHMANSKHILDDFAEKLADIATVDKPAKVEGRSLVMFLTEKRN